MQKFEAPCVNVLLTYLLSPLIYKFEIDKSTCGANELRDLVISLER